MTGAVVWFTGLPASGKSTLARRVHAQLAEAGRPAVVLDSDELREALAATSYAADGRDAFYRTVAALAALLARQGLVVLVAATATRRATRDHARAALVGIAPFVEVWVQTPLAVCAARDPKQLYARAAHGELGELPGVGVAYEPPLAAEVRADGGHDDAAVRATLARLTPPLRS